MTKEIHDLLKQYGDPIYDELGQVVIGYHLHKHPKRTILIKNEHGRFMGPTRKNANSVICDAGKFNSVKEASDVLGLSVESIKGYCRNNIKGFRYGDKDD